MRLSSAIAGAGFLIGVPAALAAAYVGYRSGLYPYAAVPFIGVGLVVVLLIGLLFLLPRVRSREGELQNP